MAQPRSYTSPLSSQEQDNIYPLISTKEINGWYVEVRIPGDRSFVIASLFTAEWGNKSFTLPSGREGISLDDLVENVWKNVTRFQLSQAEDQVVEFLHRGGKLS